MKFISLDTEGFVYRNVETIISISIVEAFKHCDIQQYAIQIVFTDETIYHYRPENLPDTLDIARKIARDLLAELEKIKNPTCTV